MATISFTGNLAADPELRYTQRGKPVAHFTVIENRRRRTANGWEDAEPNVFRVEVWEEQAEHVGDRFCGDDEREGAGIRPGQVEHPEGQCHRCEGEPEHRQGARGEERGEASLAQQTQVLAHRAHRRKIPPEGEGGVTAAT